MESCFLMASSSVPINTKFILFSVILFIFYLLKINSNDAKKSNC
jgi:hypothetical protein